MKLLITLISTFVIFKSEVFAGLHLGYNPHYTMSTITDESNSNTKGSKYTGIGHEFELGYSFNFTVVRFIPLLSLGQTKLKAASGNDKISTSYIKYDDDYSMGRLGYGLRIDLGSAIFFKFGGAIYSLTENPKPSDNAHINGDGYFAEGGLAFNLIPYLSFVLGARYELATYDKYNTDDAEGTLDDKVKQTNITGLLGISLRI